MSVENVKEFASVLKVNNTLRHINIGSEKLFILDYLLMMKKIYFFEKNL